VNLCFLCFLSFSHEINLIWTQNRNLSGNPLQSMQQSPFTLIDLFEPNPRMLIMFKIEAVLLLLYKVTQELIFFSRCSKT